MGELEPGGPHANQKLVTANFEQLKRANRRALLRGLQRQIEDKERRKREGRAMQLREEREYLAHVKKRWARACALAHSLAPPLTPCASVEDDERKEEERSRKKLEAMQDAWNKDAELRGLRRERERRMAEYFSRTTSKVRPPSLGAVPRPPSTGPGAYVGPSLATPASTARSGFGGAGVGFDRRGK